MASTLDNAQRYDMLRNILTHINFVNRWAPITCAPAQLSDRFSDVFFICLSPSFLVIPPSTPPFTPMAPVLSEMNKSGTS
ncbi:hypothetical protein Bpfe_020994 [Biomphalaria pfeifferi]|uniref:Uncharacterized protein n=1 Tax=Biomphalaria pfeifferi TaxID=112525 RepID=A0AAD8F2S6_BIOPF|nr:hypothetical protein Bpfe_020994 [Biomphalaria pfeifferi]